MLNSAMSLSTEQIEIMRPNISERYISCITRERFKITDVYINSTCLCGQVVPSYFAVWFAIVRMKILSSAWNQSENIDHFRVRFVSGGGCLVHWLSWGRNI